MKHNPNKQRHRGGRPQGKRNGFGYNNQPNRSFDSSGPDIKVRGNAYQVYEKYLQLARDANTAGDRVAAENFLQHAEHYYRILNHDGQWYQRQLQQQNQPQQHNQGGMNPNPNPQPNPYGAQPQQGPSPQLNQPAMGGPNHPQHGGHQGGPGSDTHQDDYPEPDLNNP